MAKRGSSRPKGLRDLRLLPEDPWGSAETDFRSRTDVLDHDAAIGTYSIDSVIRDLCLQHDILRDDPIDSLIREARTVADVSGAYAVRMARDELSDLPGCQDDCEQFVGHLSQIQTLSAHVQKIKADRVARVLIDRTDTAGSSRDDIGDAKRSFLNNKADIEQILEVLQDANSKLSAFLEKYEMVARQGSSAEPLTNWFIWNVASAWKSLTGEWVRASNTAGFRSFLVAAWTDLGFPEPIDRTGEPKPLEDHFRDRIAKSDVFRHFRGN
ncbi:MAG: hypothetical protein ACTHM2_08625 [Afipia sp.]